MIESIAEGIFVLATRQADRRLMDELLLESGLRGGEGDAIARESRDGETPSVRRRATIICHRVSRATPQPRVPDSTGNGRVVVFSNCTLERAVVETLEAGAHHYFDITESRPLLQARLTAALRSCTRGTGYELSVPPFHFDLGKRRVWREEQPLTLSPKEFDLAYYLFSHRGCTVGNRELMTAVWSLPRTMDSRRIDTAACRVRKKMGLEGSGEHWRLRRLRGEGYLLMAASDESS